MIVLGLLSLSHFKWSMKTLWSAYMMALSYFIWALLAQNVEKPRHIVPVVLFILFILFVMILKKRSDPMIAAICLVLLLSNSVKSVQMIYEQANQLQLAINWPNTHNKWIKALSLYMGRNKGFRLPQCFTCPIKRRDIRGLLT